MFSNPKGKEIELFLLFLFVLDLLDYQKLKIILASWLKVWEMNLYMEKNLIQSLK